MAKFSIQFIKLQDFQSTIESYSGGFILTTINTHCNVLFVFMNHYRINNSYFTRATSEVQGSRSPLYLTGNTLDHKSL